ncbi:hypothetical protein [Sorangium sp. So ce1389]|uniref:hypothetical protein n=1 Tax=Sorangium sp. So ce1389 TaxID=3133336 RepID=UPI003F616D40
MASDSSAWPQFLAALVAGYLEDTRAGGSVEFARSKNWYELDRIDTIRPTRWELVDAFGLANRTLTASRREITRVAELLACQERLSQDAICQAIRGGGAHEDVCLLPGAKLHSQPQVSSSSRALDGGQS